MSSIILHHYSASPFAEKIRLILGYKGCTWSSVRIPAILPKPELTKLTGGYRLTPVLQIGADIYCDTALIADQLERLQSEPTLFPKSCSALARLLSRSLDRQLFNYALPYAFQPQGRDVLFAGAPQKVIDAFFTDRNAMAGTQRQWTLPAARWALSQLLNELADAIKENPFVLGEAPSLVDFSLYHGVWFLNKLGAPLSDIVPPGLRSIWFERMQAFGHGNVTRVENKYADECAGNTPLQALPKPTSIVIDDLALGSAVTVTAVETNAGESVGNLVYADAERIIIRREVIDVGVVHVHFPRFGYTLKSTARKNSD